MMTNKEAAWIAWTQTTPEGGQIPYSYALAGHEEKAFNAGWDAGMAVEKDYIANLEKMVLEETLGYLCGFCDRVYRYDTGIMDEDGFTCNDCITAIDDGLTTEGLGL